MSGYGFCPRCGQWSIEYLATHSYCRECNYFPEDDLRFRDEKPIGKREADALRSAINQLLDEQPRDREPAL